MSTLAAWIAAHRKALLAYAGFAMTVLTLASQFYHWHLTWLPVVLAGLAALGVHAVPNAGAPKPPAAG